MGMSLQEVKRACEQIGSKTHLICLDTCRYVLGYYRTALPGEVAECVKDNAQAFATSYIPIGTSKKCFFL